MRVSLLLTFWLVCSSCFFGNRGSESSRDGGSSSDGRSDDSGSFGEDGNADAGSCSGSVAMWTLPGGGKRFDTTINAMCGLQNYATIDMDGDLRPELVQTYDCVGGSDVGSLYWRVYANSGTAFATSPLTWALPGGGKRFIGLRNETCGLRNYATIDMDGDSRPDLVETFDCIGGSDIGSKYWLVYRNSGSGFVTTPMQWTLPSGGKRFDTTINARCGLQNYATIDMDGDLRPELVQTYDCASGSDIGRKHWLVYHNNGTGFDSTPLTWTLPDAGHRYDSTDNRACGLANFTTLDLDGDLHPDLVETFDCASGSAQGRDYWRVYRNGGTGFGKTAILWTLPGGKRFDTTMNSSCGLIRYDTRDMDGDRKPELIQTFDCVGGSDLGSRYWRVHRNSGTGFASLPLHWLLPGLGKRFDNTANATCGLRNYDTLDMNGDRKPELVETFDCIGGSDLGSKYWRVYEASCMP